MYTGWNQNLIHFLLQFQPEHLSILSAMLYNEKTVDSMEQLKDNLRLWNNLKTLCGY